MATLSVITPVLNGEKHIRSCLECVSRQSGDIEHIIVDGGSTDQTRALVEEFAASHPHVRLIDDNRIGQSDAMNCGIAVAKGSVIGILNVDDAYEEGILHRVLDLFADAREHTIAVGNCAIYHDDGSPDELNRPIGVSAYGILAGRCPIPVNPSAYFYHKSLHDLVGLYDTKNHYAMDVDFLLRALRSAHIEYRDELWGHYYRYEETKSVQHGNDPQHEQEFRTMIQGYRKSLPPQKQVSSVIESCVRRQLRKVRGTRPLGMV